MTEETKLAVAQATDSEQPKMVDELVLEIFNFATPQTQLKMVSTCKDWYFLLVPYLAKTVFRGQIGNFETEYQFETFWKDELFKAKKLRLVDSIGTFDCPLMGDRFEWLSKLGIVELCGSIRYLSVAVFDVDSLTRLLATDLGSLTRLDLFGSFDMPQRNPFYTQTRRLTQVWQAKWKKLQVLHLEGNPPAFLCEFLAQHSPLLEKVQLKIDATLDYKKVLEYIPDNFLSKIWKFEAINCALLKPLLKRPAFKPKVVVLDAIAPSANEDDFEDHEERLWIMLSELESLKKLWVGTMTSDCLIAKFPRHAEEIHINCLEIGRLYSIFRARISNAIRDHSGKITIKVQKKLPRFPGSARLMWEWCEEIKFWCNLQYGRIAIGDIFDTQEKLKWLEPIQEYVDELVARDRGLYDDEDEDEDEEEEEEVESDEDDEGNSE